jgi:hypothetical protein
VEQAVLPVVDEIDEHISDRDREHVRPPRYGGETGEPCEHAQPDRERGAALGEVDRENGAVVERRGHGRRAGASESPPEHLGDDEGAHAGRDRVPVRPHWQVIESCGYEHRPTTK